MSNSAPSYKSLIGQLEAFAKGHFIIRKFSFGEETDYDLEKEGEYPAMHVLHPSVSLEPGFINYGLTIQFADLPRDIENKTVYQMEQISDLFRIGQDLLNVIAQNGTYQLFGENAEIVGAATMEANVQETKNNLVVVTLSFTLQLPNDWSACDIPADWTIGQSGGDTPGVPVVYVISVTGLDTDNTDPQNPIVRIAVDGTTITGEGTPEDPLVAVGGGAVDSVNGQTGVVVLDATDVGADPSGSASTAESNANNYTDTQIAALTFVEGVTGNIVDNTDPQNPIVTQVQSDWNQSDNTEPDFIKNKPTIPTDTGITELTGDVTAGPGSGSQAATIANNAVTYAKMQDIASNHLIGRHTAGSGDPQSINIDGGLELNGANIRRSALTGDVTASAGSDTTTIANDAVTYAKMQNVSAESRLLGRGAGSGSGDVQEITLGTGLSMSGTTLNGNAGTVTSVGLSMPAAFNVANSPVTGSGTLTVTGAGTTSQYVRGDGSLATFPTIPTGTVTSVGLSAPSEFTVSNSPVTSSGTLTFAKANQNANLVYAGPTTGAAAAPTFRSLVVDDIPSSIPRQDSSMNGQNWNASTVGAGLTRFMSAYSGIADSAGTTASQRESIVVTAGTISRLYIRTFTQQPASGSIVFTFMLNNAATAMTITIAAGSAAGVFNDLTNTVTVAAGDAICVRAVNNATGASAQLLGCYWLFTR